MWAGVPPIEEEDEGPQLTFFPEDESEASGLQDEEEDEAEGEGEGCHVPLFSFLLSRQFLAGR